jgi:hypothetical protein
MCGLAGFMVCGARHQIDRHAYHNGIRAHPALAESVCENAKRRGPFSLDNPFFARLSSMS